MSLAAEEDGEEDEGKKRGIWRALRHDVDGEGTAH